MSKRRVVVTGLGMISPLGNSVAETWTQICAGRSGIRPITAFDTTDFPVKIAGTLDHFDPSAHFSPKALRKLDPFTQFGLVAAQEALEDAGLTAYTGDPNRVGVAVGSGIGGISTILDNHVRFKKGGARKVSPFFIPAGIINMLAGNISIEFGFKGPNIAIVTACTTGTHNIGAAARMIAHGDADVMVAGGAEKGEIDLCLAGFAAARALSTRNDAPEKASRPWDKDRDGFVLGEGAGILILEEAEHAKARGANIYAEVAGFGMSSDAYHITAPDSSGEGFVATMQNALNDAGLTAQDIDYINAHGTSTPAGDVIEAGAIKQAFGEHAKKLAVSSTKSMTGHLLGAAGAVEAIFSLLAMRDSVLPPTINLDNPDEGCDLNFVPHEAQAASLTAVLSNSFGFGGTNGSLIFKKF